VNWIVVSFYTKNTGYADVVKKLEASLIEHNLDYHLFSCEPLGSWRQNLNYKSKIILESFDLYPDKDIVFIDADGVVQKYPTLFDKLSEDHAHDIAAHFHPYKGTNINGGSLLSGTLWIQNNDRGRMLVKEWDKIGRAHPTIRHQHCLRLAINELKKAGVDIRVYRLPREYTLIFDYYRGRNRPDPVIEHFQASRKFRKEVGYGKGLLNSNFSTLAEKRRMDQRAKAVRRAVARRKMISTQGIKPTA
jgi:hypothetical protein